LGIFPLSATKKVNFGGLWAVLNSFWGGKLIFLGVSGTILSSVPPLGDKFGIFLPFHNGKIQFWGIWAWFCVHFGV